MFHTPTDRDHSLSIKDAIKSGVAVFSNEEVQSIHYGVKALQRGKKVRCGGFLIQRVDLFHNAECIGFLIEHKGMGRLLFCTDTNSIPYRFKNIHHFMVEANYSNDVLLDNLCNDVHNRSASENHMEVNDTIEFLKHNVTPNTMNVILIHLSNGNIDANKAKEQVKRELSFSNVFVADAGLELELSEEEF